jgi:hypothetical protein
MNRNRIALPDYADLIGLDPADAIHDAVVSGLVVGVYDCLLMQGSDDASEEAAKVAAAEDPSLVYLTGTDEQTGVSAADLDLLAGVGFGPPIIIDAATGWVVSYPVTGAWGVTRNAEDTGWTLINGHDGYMDETHTGLDLDAALDECEVRNAG